MTQILGAFETLRQAIQNRDVKIAELEATVAVREQQIQTLEHNESHWITELDKSRTALAKTMDERDKMSTEIADLKVKIDVLQEAKDAHESIAIGVLQLLFNVRETVLKHTFGKDDPNILIASLATMIEAGGLMAPDVKKAAEQFAELRDCLIKARDALKAANGGWYPMGFVARVDQLLIDTRPKEM